MLTRQTKERDSSVCLRDVGPFRKQFLEECLALNQFTRKVKGTLQSREQIGAERTKRQSTQFGKSACSSIKQRTSSKYPESDGGCPQTEYHRLVALAVLETRILTSRTGQGCAGLSCL
ncbi:uncharacterized protein LOC143666756 [Tamandua tetradactyla]|uniref:uncharacterized protein LOC143666756 n=1 Tax=Tamandua tetradactyla TaxID=48850 RepID=UPI00405404FD